MSIFGEHLRTCSAIGLSIFEAVGDLLNAHDQQPIVFELWHRPHGKARWALIATRSSHGDAVRLIDGAGDFLISTTRRDPNGGTSDRATVEKQPVLFVWEPRSGAETSAGQAADNRAPQSV